MFDSMDGSLPSRTGFDDRHEMVTTNSTDLSRLPRVAQMGLKEFVTKITPLIREYFVSRNDEIVFESLKEMDSPHFHDMFALKLIRMSFDQSDQVQVQVRALLTLLHDAKLIRSDQLLRVFEKLVQSCEDLALDVPDVPDRLVTFVEDACSDAVLPEAFVSKLPEDFFKMISPALRAANPMIDSQQDKLHSYKVACQEFFSKDNDFFHCATGRDAADLSEVFLTQEATNPLFRHEFIRILICMAISKPRRTKDIAAHTLTLLMEKDLITTLDLEVAFARLIGRVEDLRLDDPDASLVISKFLAKAIVDDVVHPGIVWDYYRLHLGGREGMDVLTTVRRWLVDERVTPLGLEERQKPLLIERFGKIFEDGYDPAVMPAAQFRGQLRDRIFAYYDDGELDETADHIISLDLSTEQRAELVRRVLAFSQERTEKEERLSLALLCGLVRSETLSNKDVSAGVLQLKDMMSEIILDCPRAQERWVMTVIEHAEYPNSCRLWKQWVFITPCEFERHTL